MFRELVRKQQALSHEECLALLRQEKRGVLSVQGDDGYPYGMPMNHFYCDEDGAIYFHCGKVGHRLDALRRCGKVSFCVFDGGEPIPGNWALRVKSVIVFGQIEILDDQALVVDISEKLCRKFTEDETYIQNEIRQFAAATLLLRLTPEHICGKLVKES